MIKVSVIIPVYNVEDYLQECLDSVINQTLKNIEIICIDDGSTDKSSEILKEYSQKDSRIKTIRQPNSGAGKARNVGIEIAKGEYIFFLDSDDCLKQTALERLTLSIKNSDICVCKALYEDKSSITHSLNIKKLLKYETISSKNNSDIIFNFCLPALFIKLYKTDFIKKNNIRCQEIKVCNDVFFNYATLGLANSVSYINEALIIHRKNRKNSLTSNRGNYPECIFEAFISLRTFFRSRRILKNFEKSFYKCAQKRFEYELKYCHPLYINDFYQEAENFMYERKLISKIFKCKNYGVQKFFTLLGIKFKVSNHPKNIKLLLKRWFLLKTGKHLDLNNPETFNEKIQWLKLYDSTPLKTKLADKYLVREWVKEKIGQEYLIPLLGVWDKFDEIDFDKLPNKFVLKCNHGSGYNIVVDDKSKFNKKDTRKKINKWLKENYAYRAGYELHYSNIPRKIIAEEYIQNKNGLDDYKLYCFNGKVKYIQLITDRDSSYSMKFFDRNWNVQNFISNHRQTEKIFNKPENLDLLIKLAETLSNEFAFVRVDFYITDNNKIIFGEMTFTPASGIMKWKPEEINLKLGKLLHLPKKFKTSR